MIKFSRFTTAASILALGLLTMPSLAQTAPAASGTGDMHITYAFTPNDVAAPVSEPMSYRLYVPASYNPKRAMPLVVLLHGAGGNENSILDEPGAPKIKSLADKHGFIVLLPRGYKGGYGNIYPVVVTKETAARSAAAKLPGAVREAPPAERPVVTKAVAVNDYAEQAASELTPSRPNQLSEQEVLAAIAEVRKAYTIDAKRLYVTGNSMGGVGTAYLAAKYPAMWAAIAPSGGPLAAWSYPFARLRTNKVPALFVHGEIDEHANPHWTEVNFNTAKAEGVDASLLIVKGANHHDGWVQAIPQIFDFFDKHTRLK